MEGVEVMEWTIAPCFLAVWFSGPTSEVPTHLSVGMRQDFAFLALLKAGAVDCRETIGIQIIKPDSAYFRYWYFRLADGMIIQILADKARASNPLLIEGLALRPTEGDAISKKYNWKSARKISLK